MTKPVDWPLPGLADDVAIAAGAGALWVAASTATLASEEVWLGEVTAAGIAQPWRVAPACCRPAIAALPDGGALAIACLPEGRIAGARVRGGELARWQRALDGVPLHVAIVAGHTTWLAVELARGPDRHVIVANIDPDTGAIRHQVQLGGGVRWCRWPALALDEDELIVAWCEGPARAVGAVMVARWKRWLDATRIAETGEAPALAVLPDRRVAIAWHRGGPSAAPDDREASVVRAIDVALADLSGATAAVTPATPPAGAGGSDPRGEDQGWELAALAADAGGALWLAGRSTHGHHLARRDPDGTWWGPAALDAGGWGGRGRRHGLAVHAGEVWLARRAPDGVVVGPCAAELPPAGPAPARIAPARLAPRRVPGVQFGDLHQHTAHSDGCGSFEDLWIAARDRRRLDFAAITDHDQFCRRALGPATWQLATHVAAGFDDPGRFVALAGYEFTGARHPGPGHKCVYFGNRVPPRVPDKEVAELFAVLRAYNGICVPHHVGWTGGGFAHHDPVLQPVWEICSVHGCYEGEGACGAHPPRADHVIPGQFVRDALATGLVFGFIGSTDSHGLDWHHGIARWRNPFRAGLACVVDAEPTRDGILDALRARRSYATSGARIGLRIELEGAPLGSELPAGTRGELAIEIDGTAPITQLAIVSDRGEQAIAVARERRVAARAPVPEDATYVYVRVEQEDDEAAWASPFWLVG